MSAHLKCYTKKKGNEFNMLIFFFHCTFNIIMTVGSWVDSWQE